MSVEYLRDPQPPSIEQLLETVSLTISLHDPTIAGDVTFRDIFARLYLSEYGAKLAACDLRYAAHFGYEPRPLMAYEYGYDADPVAHNFTTYTHTLNAIRVEETRGIHRLTPRQKDVVLFSAGTHDAVEGIVGDQPRGSKTPEFKNWENSERQAMFAAIYTGVLPADFLKAADDIIAHKNTGIEHDYFELGHTITQLTAGLRVARICFQLLDGGFSLTPFGSTPGSEERRAKLISMAVAVTRNTSNDLNEFAKKDFWIASSILTYHAPLRRKIEEQLAPLIAVE